MAPNPSPPGTPTNTTNFDPEPTKYTLLLNLHYDTTTLYPKEPSFDQEDAIIIPYTPEFEDERIVTAVITLENTRAASLESLVLVNPNQTITGITVINSGDIKFAHHGLVEIRPHNWDMYLHAGIWKTCETIKEAWEEEVRRTGTWGERVVGELEFDLEEEDDDDEEDHSGDYEMI